MGGQRHAPGHFTPGKETRYPLYRRLVGPHGRSGRVRKISPPTGIRSLDLPARSKSLYRLSYPGHSHRGTTIKCPLFLSNFHEPGLCSTHFRKILKSHCHGIPFSGSRVLPCGRTDDGQTDITKLIVAFRNFESAPKTISIFLYVSLIMIMVRTGC